MKKSLEKLWAFATLEMKKQYSSQHCFLLIMDEILQLKRHTVKWKGLFEKKNLVQFAITEVSLQYGKKKNFISDGQNYLKL